MAEIENKTEAVEETAVNDKKKKKKEKRVSGFENHNRGRVIIGFSMIIAAFLLGVLLIFSMGQKPTKVSVLVAKTDIPCGTEFTADNIYDYFGIRETSDPSETMILAANASVTYGKYAAYDILDGVDLMNFYLTSTKTVSTDLIPEGKELVAMSVPSACADVGYMPQVGDVVRFYYIENASGDPENPNEYYVDEEGLVQAVMRNRAVTYDLLYNVEIYMLLDGSGNDVGEYNKTHLEKVNPSMILLLCEPEQARQVIELQSFGSVYFTLISSGDEERKAELLNDQYEYILRYRAARELIEDIEYDEVIIPLSAFKLTSGYIPESGDTVCFKYEDDKITYSISADGTLNEVVKSEIITPEVLEYVAVTNVYDSNNAIVNTSVIVGQTIDSSNLFVGLKLAKEQREELSRDLQTYEEVEIARLGTSLYDYSAGFEVIDSYIRLSRLDAVTINDGSDAVAEEIAEEQTTTEE